MGKTEIFLKDGSKYLFTTSSYNAENPLGMIKAVLKEFIIFHPNNYDAAFCKLYKTKEGNWYDVSLNDSVNCILLTAIKMAIDEFENSNAFHLSA